MRQNRPLSLIPMSCMLKSKVDYLVWTNTLLHLPLQYYPKRSEGAKIADMLGHCVEESDS